MCFCRTPGGGWVLGLQKMVAGEGKKRPAIGACVFVWIADGKGIIVLRVWSRVFFQLAGPNERDVRDRD